MYHQLTELLGDATIDLDGHTFKVALMNATHTFVPTNTVWADVSANEVANGFGYTTGGATLASVTWSQTTGTATFDFTDPEWTASGGSIGPTAHAVFYDDTVAGGPLMFSVDFGQTITAVDGVRIVIQLAATGLFQNVPV